MVRTVLCYGDSNTHGTAPMADLDDKVRFDAATRWPGVMRTALGEGWKVIEEGLPGRTTVHADPVEGEHKNGLAVLPAILETHCPVDLVIVMLGTNDLKMRFSLTAYDIARGADRLLGVIAGSEAGPDRGPPKVLLVSPPPIIETGCLAEMFSGGADKSRHLADRMARIAESRGATFLDAATVIGSSPVDGIHYDENAHSRLGAAMAEAVRAI